MNTFHKLPSAFAFQRSFVLTDGIFFNKYDSGKLSPVLVVQHGIRGTQNVNTVKGADNVTNIQVTETAKLEDEAVSLVVRFDLRTAPLSDAISMCSEAGGKNDLGKKVRQGIQDFIKQAGDGLALQQLCERYARNILNGRWLWRNRSYAQKITINVISEGNTVCSVDALSIPLNHFNEMTAAEKDLAVILAKGLSSRDGAAIQVEAEIDFGVRGAMEVYPSQNYNPEKVKGFARSLYKVRFKGVAPDLGDGIRAVGIAALRDQKLGNALRTIDTWYKTFDELRLVTPIEPMAANLDIGEFLRDKKECAFELLKAIPSIDPASDDGQYLLAILIRGGVFGEKKAGKGADEEEGE